MSINFKGPCIALRNRLTMMLLLTIVSIACYREKIFQKGQIVHSQLITLLVTAEATASFFCSA